MKDSPNQNYAFLLLQRANFPKLRKTVGTADKEKHIQCERQKKSSHKASIKWPKDCDFAITESSNFTIKPQRGSQKANGK